MPRLSENFDYINSETDMTFIPLEKAHRLHEGYMQCFNTGGLQLLMIQEEGRTHLVENRCPHMDAPLTHGSVREGFIRCPMHGIEFNLLDGQSKNGVGGCLRRFALAYEGNQVGIIV